MKRVLGISLIVAGAYFILTITMLPAINSNKSNLRRDAWVAWLIIGGLLVAGGLWTLRRPVR